MPGFSVKVNGIEIATVSVDGLNILSVQVHGDIIGEEFAELQIFGGCYEGEETDTHLIWVSEYEIELNDVIDISFMETATTSYPGKTIEELHPEPSEVMGPWLPNERMFEYLSNQPRLRNGFSFTLDSPAGEAVCANTSEGDYSFNFAVMWKWLHPEKVSVWLTSNTLQGIEKRENGKIHARFNLQYDQGVKLHIGT